MVQSQFEDEVGFEVLYGESNEKCSKKTQEKITNLTVN